MVFSSPYKAHATRQARENNQEVKVNNHVSLNVSPSSTQTNHRWQTLLIAVVISPLIFALAWLAEIQYTPASAAPNASICGAKFNDLNGDGVWDQIAEPTLPNWEIQLEGGNQFVTATTSADGYYCFNDLPDGQYFVSEVMQEGWQQTFPNPSTGTTGHVVIIQGGVSNDQIHFGNHSLIPREGIAGYKFYDENNNGLWDSGESGLADWVIELTDGNTVWTTTTGLDGSYQFTGLITGTYTITEQLQPGWAQTFPALGYHVVVYASGQYIQNQNFGNYVPPAVIHGQKFHDRDGNGVKGQGEEGLPNWTIMANSNNATISTQTDAQGHYTLTVPPGSYTVFETQPMPYWNGNAMVQWTQTTPASGTYTATLASGQLLQGQDFGNWQSGQADFCMIPWDNHFLDQISLETEVYIFNASATGVETFTVQLAGPSAMTITTPLPVALGPFEYAAIDVEIAYPASFTGPSQNAQFQAIVTNLTTNTTFTCHAALWSYSPQWWTAPNVHSGLSGGIPMGFTQGISFTVSSPGGGGLQRTVAATADYRIWAMSRGYTDTTSVVSLNGLAPGAVITGQITLEPGEEFHIPLTVSFTDFNWLAPTDIILELDTDGDGFPDAVTSYLIFLEAPRIYLPLVTR